jgi:hypothetical protein
MQNQEAMMKSAPFSVAMFILAALIPTSAWSAVTNCYVASDGDVSVYSANPGYVNPNDPTLYVGYDGTGAYRTYMKFNFSPIVIPPGYTVDVVQATLRIYVETHAGVTYSYLMDRVSSSWTEGSVTWNSQPTTDTTLGTIPLYTPGQYNEAYLAAWQVENWINGTYPNYGIALLGQGEAWPTPVHWSTLKSSENTMYPPYLIVTYNLVPPCTVPGTPTATLPICGSQVAAGNVVLTWSAIGIATSYDYELYTNGNCSGTPAATGSVPTATYTWAGVPANGSYSWHVRARNNNNPSPCSPEGVGLWSTCCSFFTTCPVPGVATPLTPACGSAQPAGTTSVTLTWSPGSNATAYYVELYDGESCSDTYIQNSTVATTTKTFNGLSTGTYSWRVQSLNQNCDPTTFSDWSACCSFIILPPSQGCLTPANAGFEDGLQQAAWHLGEAGPCGGAGGAPLLYDAQAGDPANVHSGRYSIQMNFNSQKMWQEIDTAVPGGCRVIFSLWVRMPTQGSPATKVLCLDMCGLTEGNAFVWGKTSYPEFGGPYPTWTPIQVDYVTPAPVAKVIITVHTMNGGGCGSICFNPIWLDDALLVSDVGVGNPGFEDGVSQVQWHLGDPWYVHGDQNNPNIYDGDAGDPSNVHSGRYSLELTFDSEEAWQIVETPIPANQRVTLSAWVKMPTQGSLGTKILTLEVLGMNGPQEVVWNTSSYPQYTGPYSDWTFVSISYDTPVAAAWIAFDINTGNGSGCGSICNHSIWIDDVSVTSSCPVVPGIPSVIPSLPGPVGLQLNVPNPYHANDAITLDLGNLGGEGRALVYNAAGRLVRTLRSRPVDGRMVQFHWDGRSDDGREVGSGVYFIRARVGVAVQQRTFILVR